MKKRVLITNILPSLAFQKLSKNFNVTWNKKQLTENQLATQVKSYHALLTTLADPISEKVLKAATLLECVSNYAVGYNNIDLKSAKNKKIWVTNTPNVLTDATADIAWALLLACARRLPEGERLLQDNKFKGWHPLMLLGVDLYQKTIGIYGFGRIGKAIAQRSKGWDMKVLYHQRHREKSSIEKAHNAQYVSFANLLENSDFISVNAPLTDETYHRFTRKEFKQMKPTSIFINTSRGPLHNEKDLAEALKKGIIFSAGLDVYEFEPQINPLLLKLPNCTLLPHLGSATLDTRNKMALLAAQNIINVLTGHRPITPVSILR